MLRKVISFCLVLCMAFTLIIPGYAQSSYEKISSDTVITENNIYDVLEYLGIDSSNFEFSDNVKAGAVTVGDLEKTISEIKNASKEPKNSRSFAVNPSFASKGITVNKTLYHESDYDQYSLMFSCTGTFEIGAAGWKSCSGGSVTEDSWDPIVAKIKGSPSLSTFLSSDKSKVCMTYTVVVDIYTGVADFGIIYLHSATHKGTNYWAASEFANT